MSKFSSWLKTKSGGALPEIRIDPSRPLDGLKQVYKLIPEDLRNEAGSAIIAQAGGIEKFLDSLPDEEKFKVREWVDKHSESTGGKEWL